MQENQNKMLEKAPLLAYLALSLCIVFAVAQGARVYAKIAQRGIDGPAARTAAQFAATKIRQGDRAGGLACSDGRLYGYEYINANDNTECFADMVYYYDGWLMELYQESGAVLDGGMDDAGDKILECGSASFYYNDGAIIAEIDVSGRQLACAVHVRGGVMDP